MIGRFLARLGGADVWLLDLAATDGCHAAAWAALSRSERAHVAAMTRPSLQRAAVAARAGLREVLAAYRPAGPRGLEIREDHAGKPWIDGGPTFNMTHSGGLGLCAVAGRLAVGIDVEQVRPVAGVHELAEETLGSTGLAAYLADGRGDSDERFLRHWTRREAYLKARGLGLPGLQTAGDMDPACWALHELRPAPGYVGALVVEIPDGAMPEGGTTTDRVR